MQIIPVLDVQGGIVVHAVAGRRDGYRPLASFLTRSTEPTAVRDALIQATGAMAVYVADLDAITQGTGLSPAVAELLNSPGIMHWIDAGIRDGHDLDRLPAADNLTVVLGTETLLNWETAASALARFGPDRVVLSLDRRGAQGQGTLYQSLSLIDLAFQWMNTGGKRLILIDLMTVGTSNTNQMEDCRLLRHHFPALEIYPGGGVRDERDWMAYELAGADGLLMATALHQGIRFPPMKATRGCSAGR